MTKVRALLIFSPLIVTLSACGEILQAPTPSDPPILSEAASRPLPDGGSAALDPTIDAGPVDASTRDAKEGNSASFCLCEGKACAMRISDQCGSAGVFSCPVAADVSDRCKEVTLYQDQHAYCCR